MIPNEVVLNEVMKDTADAIREKTGKSEKIAPINFAEEIKSISAGGGESGGEELGMIYVTKEELLTGLGTDPNQSMSQEEFAEAIKQITPLFGIRALKRASGTTYGIEEDVSNAIYEGWLTYDNWVAAALYLDTPAWYQGKWEKTWVLFGATTVDEARAIFAQMFPNQLTEEEFLA